jgi:hypothetical protein
VSVIPDSPSAERELIQKARIDTNMLPEQLEKVLQQVQANADYMPDWQLEVCLFILCLFLIATDSTFTDSE